MSEINFKAERYESRSCAGYRAIKKTGDIEYDMANTSDDVIILYTKNLKGNVIIDCNKKTGVFSLKFDVDGSTDTNA